jgi:hypothetical protein
MLTEETGYRVTVLEDGQVQVCRVTHILRDGVEIGKQLHRYVLEPGQDMKDQDAKVASVAETVWTPTVVSAYQEKKAAASK